jgi:diacylglycerol kinase family enzyme
MRVAMLYNEGAGRQVRLDHIRDLIAEHGHELIRVHDKKVEVERLLEGGPDIVAAAGGDGTIGRAARTLARTGIPLAILPLGTANNIARSVGTSTDIDVLVAGWTTARRMRVDLGVATGPWGQRFFVEGVGSGLLPTAITAARNRGDLDDLPAHEQVTEGVTTVSGVLSRLQPAKWTIVADGARTAGEFLLVEVLNLGAIGPNLVLSPDVDPSDGLFRVVIAGEEHRDELERYMRGLIDGRNHTPSLISQPARQVTLEGATEVHVDDEVCSADGHTISMRVEPGALELLM